MLRVGTGLCGRARIAAGEIVKSADRRWPHLTSLVSRMAIARFPHGHFKRGMAISLLPEETKRMVKDLIANKDEDTQVMVIAILVEKFERQLAKMDLEAKEKELEHRIKMLEAKEKVLQLQLEAKEKEHQHQLAKKELEHQLAKKELEAIEKEHQLRLEAKEKEHQLRLAKKELEHQAEKKEFQIEKYKADLSNVTQRMLFERFFTRVAAKVVEHSSGTEAIDLGLSEAMIKDMRNLSISFSRMNRLLVQNENLRKKVWEWIGLSEKVKLPAFKDGLLYSRLSECLHLYIPVGKNVYVANVTKEEEKAFYQEVAALLDLKVKEYDEEKAELARTADEMEGV